MQGEYGQRRVWAWNLSALVYTWSYIKLAHQIDSDFLTYLEKRLVGAMVADCGCGPGVVAAKLLAAGVRTVVAIDVNAGMIRQAQTLLAEPITCGQAMVVQGSMESDVLTQICTRQLGGNKFDMILFKRSLYTSRARALHILRQAAAVLLAQGIIVVVHPERALRRYAFAPPFGVTSYTLFHLLNRGISRLLEWYGVEEYTVYTREELLALCREALPEATVTWIPSRQHAYNLAMVQMP